MANVVWNLVLFSILYHVLIYVVIVENDNDYHGAGVSAFSSTCSSMRSSLRSVPRTTVTGDSNRKIIDNTRNYPFSFTVYAKDLSTTTTATKGDSNNDDEQSSMPPADVAGPFALLLTSQFLLFIGVGAVIPSIPLYGKEIGLSGAANGLVISAPAVALFLFANWSGRRADIARKPAMMIGMAVIAVSDLGTAFAQGIYTLVLARLGLGVGRALGEAGERGMLVDLANQIPELRGRALAAQQAAVALGIAIGAPAGGVVVEHYGPRAAFLCVSVAAITALVLYSFLPETIVRSPDTASLDVTRTADDSDSTEVLDENTSGVKVWIELLNKNTTARILHICTSYLPGESKVFLKSYVHTMV
jgi:hypothetical protein